MQGGNSNVKLPGTPGLEACTRFTGRHSTPTRPQTHTESGKDLESPRTISVVQSPKRTASLGLRYTVWLGCVARQAKWWMSPITSVCAC